MMRNFTADFLFSHLEPRHNVQCHRQVLVNPHNLRWKSWRETGVLHWWLFCAWEWETEAKGQKTITFMVLSWFKLYLHIYSLEIIAKIYSVSCGEGFICRYFEDVVCSNSCFGRDNSAYLCLGKTKIKAWSALNSNISLLMTAFRNVQKVSVENCKL